MSVTGDLNYVDLILKSGELETPGDKSESRFKVRVTNGVGEAVPVSLTPYPSINIFTEISSLAASVLTTIATYTVPVGKVFYLEAVEVTGTNIAEYTVELNSSVIAKRRTYFPEFNTNFNFFQSNYAAGDIIRSRVIHTRSAVGDFSARITGKLVDA